MASGGWDGTIGVWVAPYAEGDAAERWAGAGPDPARGGQPRATLLGHTGAAAQRTTLHALGAVEQNALTVPLAFRELIG